MAKYEIKKIGGAKARGEIVAALKYLRYLR